MEEKLINNEHDLLKVREVAEYLRLSEQCLYRLARNNQIPHYKLGGSVRFNKAEMEQYLKSRFFPEIAIPVVQVAQQEAKAVKATKKGKKKGKSK